MRTQHMALLIVVILWLAPLAGAIDAILPPDKLQTYVGQFNAADNELYRQHVPNVKAAEFLRANVPRFECPDAEIERTYYFRWWTYRKHIKDTPDGFVITEFLPAVGWAGKHNTISCPAGHHLYEGRWLRDPKFLDDYSVFWFRKGGEPRRYSFWAADAIRARSLVSGDVSLPRELLPDLIANYRAWETNAPSQGGILRYIATQPDKPRAHLDSCGLFWQLDDRDGGEVSIGGHGYRPTINSYMFGDAQAIAAIADAAGKADMARQFREKAARLKRLVQSRLWDAQAQFFKTLPRGEIAQFVDVRELHGYTPWYFNLPDVSRAVAWKQVMDPKGFYAPFGLTTAEQRHPKFTIAYKGHECQWNGPSWPFATAITLTAMANLLNSAPQDAVDKRDYFNLLRIYARSHRLKLDDGSVVPWIDENLNPLTGDWISRTRLKSWENGTWSARKGGVERGKDYNHSTYCDLIITGLVGLRPRADDTVEVNPLAPDDWDYFCLDNIAYHGRTLTILWDKTGQRYGKGQGLRVLADGREIAAAGKLQRVTGQLLSTNSSQTSSTAAGWTKCAGNPVLGGKLGTCFDISLLKEDGRFRMWFSWRPKKSIALAESKDGIHWSEPLIVLGPNAASGWEDNMNRPVVVRRGDGYHMWFTGQARGGSWIGYATSHDGKVWKRMTEKPVFSPEAPWEKVAVMCPHVIWDDAAKQFRMWYSGGEQNEPNAIGYATSPDGVVWTKLPSNPIFAADPKSEWERHKVTACQVMRHGDWHLMFYIGFRTERFAQIGIARSRDGISDWQRLTANPIIRPTPGAWDASACYKPFAILDGDRWLLWYNGRKDRVEQIGLATHDGGELWLP
ncbi:MAG: glycosyl hydrolase family 65 protein [Verrucomicrobiia bacterium]